MANINWIKVALAEKGKIGKWLSEEIGKNHAQLASVAVIAFKLI